MKKTRDLPDSRRRVAYLNRGRVTDAKAYVDATIANSQATGVLVVVAERDGSISHRLFGEVQTRDCAFIGAKLLKWSQEES